CGCYGRSKLPPSIEERRDFALGARTPPFASMQSTRPRTSRHGRRVPHERRFRPRAYLASVLLAAVVFVLAWTCASARASGPDVQQQPQTADSAAQKVRRVAAR